MDFHVIYDTVVNPQPSYCHLHVRKGQLLYFGGWPHPEGVNDPSYPVAFSVNSRTSDFISFQNSRYHADGRHQKGFGAIQEDGNQIEITIIVNRATLIWQPIGARHEVVASDGRSPTAIQRTYSLKASGEFDTMDSDIDPAELARFLDTIECDQASAQEDSGELRNTNVAEKGEGTT